MDGSLGSHTAAFAEPFSDAAATKATAGQALDRGLFVTPPEDLSTWISGADKAGLHVMVHAIGDRANRTLLDIFERVGKENGARDRRFRIEHAQHPRRRHFPRFGALGCHCEMQPYSRIDTGAGRRRSRTGSIKGTMPPGRCGFWRAWRSAATVRRAAAPSRGNLCAVTRRSSTTKSRRGGVPNRKFRVEEEARRAYTGAVHNASLQARETHDREGHGRPYRIDRDRRVMPAAESREARFAANVADGRRFQQ